MGGTGGRGLPVVSGECPSRWDPSSGDRGPGGIFSHCNGAEGCGDSWIVKDHRTEGEIHINKRDLNLYKGESEEYSSFGDTEGDGSLEGAVYGLFAAEDIVHPDSELGGDGKLTNTGIVYKKDDLTAVAATDQDGNAGFTVYTEAPGTTFDYDAGKTVRRDGSRLERSWKPLWGKSVRQWKLLDRETSDPGTVLCEGTVQKRGI